MPKKKRNYKKEYENYQGKEKQKENRAARNSSRAAMKKKGKVSKGDGKDVHHKDNNPMNQDKTNLSIVTKNYNRKEPRLREDKTEE